MDHIQPTPKQIVSWCRRHDWGRDAEYDQSSNRIIDLYDSEQDCMTTLPCNLQRIKEWAGY